MSKLKSKQLPDNVLLYGDGSGSIPIEADAMTLNGHQDTYFVAKDEIDYSLYRQVIINGNFDIWQRGVSQTAYGYGSDDRWLNQFSGSTRTHSRQTFALGQTEVPNNPTYFSRTIVTSVAGAGNYVVKSQAIEDVTRLAGKTFTLSFWAKADTNGKCIVVEFGQNFGTGGSSVVNAFGIEKFTLTTSWQKYTTIVTFPSIAGKTIGANHSTFMNFWFDAGSSFDARTGALGQQSGTFDMAQIQLNIGDIALPFLTRSFEEELRLCQRYYEKSYPYENYAGQTPWAGVIDVFSQAATTISTNIKYKVEKRATATVTLYNPGVANTTGSFRCTDGTNLNANYSGNCEHGFYIYSATAAVTGKEYVIHWTADAEL